MHIAGGKILLVLLKCVTKFHMRKTAVSQQIGRYKPSYLVWKYSKYAQERTKTLKWDTENVFVMAMWCITGHRSKENARHVFNCFSSAKQQWFVMLLLITKNKLSTHQTVWCLSFPTNLWGFKGWKEKNAWFTQWPKEPCWDLPDPGSAENKGRVRKKNIITHSQQ